ncbi:MAG: EAL domain-containing protein [Desulfitobacteriaceae bacterium]|nr:EAL domain-containing protein [Desulfitobacteriaceae bacterium]MDI6878384.1 EAL domain-containing protein [Desulfitobacteriaceae bacterium]MDI6913280.1 EAL domain-containing protein [Desulfitobacteriaceae bacterium]
MKFPNPFPSYRNPLQNLTPRRITLLYLLFGAGWILASDHILNFLIPNREIFLSIQTIKGWLFVLLTAMLLYHLIEHGMVVLRLSEQELQTNLADLEATHEELVAAEEELSQQFEAIQATEARFRRIYEGVSSGVLIQNLSGVVLHANQASKRLLGLSYTQLTRIKPLSEHWQAEYEDGTPFVWEDLPERYVAGKLERLVDHLCIIQGERRYRWLTCTTDPIINPETGFIEEFVTTLEDITLEKAFEAEEALTKKQLEESQERAQVTLESIGDGVITTDVHGRIEYLNPVAADLTGWRSEEAQGLGLDSVFHTISDMNNEPAENPVARCLAEGRIVDVTNHTVLVHRDGYQFAIEDSAAPIRDRQGAIIGAVLVFRDVSDKRNLLHQMTHQAHHDALTELPNRLLFNDRLSQAIAQSHRKNKKAAILFLDIDRFKLVNDTLGHTVGDLLLKAVSERLKRMLRQGDTIARQGGDEFIILLPDVASSQEAGIVAQKILEVFSEPFILSEEEVFVTSSIGISLYPTDGRDIESLIKHADTAMYCAKESGHNNFQFFTTALNSSAQERLEIERSLRRALDKEEFIIHYQPVISLSNGMIVGVEALVRWLHPHKGLIPPGQFIPIAEDTGLIVPLGKWVLRTACAQAAAWQMHGYPLRMAVNLSARQFRQPNLAETIKEVLAETSLEPHLLELEITESIAAQDIDLTISILNDLKAMGIHISIDDFGTGFSSLSYLRSFPIDTLKIDKSFVKDIRPEHGDEIVTAIIDLAQNLQLRVIAEGVETEEQLAFLKGKHCDEIQGYIFSKPLPSSDVNTLLCR